MAAGAVLQQCSSIEMLVLRDAAHVACLLSTFRQLRSHHNDIAVAGVCTCDAARRVQKNNTLQLNIKALKHLHERYAQNWQVPWRGSVGLSLLTSYMTE
jgi:hypothetical protein